MHRFVPSLMAVVVIAACEKDQSFGTVWNREAVVETKRAFVYGVVTNARTGDLLDEADVTVGDVPTKARRGLFVVRDVPRGRRLVKGRTPGFAPGTRPVDVPASGGVFLQLALLPYEATATFAAQTGGTVETELGFRVTFPPCAIGAKGTVTASLATVVATNRCDLGALPGDFSTDGGEMLESFGAVAVDVRDEDGNAVHLGDCADAEVEIPAPGGTPDVVDQWRFDPDEGRWTRDGQGFDCTLNAAGIGTCRGDLPSLGWWNCDRPLRTTCLRACVVDEQDRAAAGVEVVAQGFDYAGRAVAFTGDDGCACLDVMRGATAYVTAVGPAGVAGPVTFTTQDVATSCAEGGCEELPEPFRVARPPFQAFLTWEETEVARWPTRPLSHLAGPCPLEDGGTVEAIRTWLESWILGEALAQGEQRYCAEGAERFHVCSWDQGSLFAPPFAYVQTSHPDGALSCGPRSWAVTVISRFQEGRYRYSVSPEGATAAYFADSLAGSMAEVLVVLPTGAVREFALPSAAGEGDTWIVGDIVCDGDLCSWRSVDTLGSTEDLTTFDPEGLAPSCGGKPSGP